MKWTICTRCRERPKVEGTSWCAECTKKYHEDYRATHRLNKRRLKKAELELIVRVLKVFDQSAYLGLLSEKEQKIFGVALKKMQGKKANE